MKRVNGKNKKGTVLLAVTCMGMVCVTLATVALSVVNYTNGATARNVMRSQAKVTAEACLTEFISAYTGTDPVTLKPNYEKLQTLAGTHTESSPLEIEVNPGNAGFNSSYGTTKIQIFKEGGGFKVKSVCTFGGDGPLRAQTQSASVKFAAAYSTPQLPNNALEASEGVDNSAEMACPIEGDIYLERKDLDTDGDGTPDSPESDRIVWIGAQDCTYNSSLYSEFSLKFGNGVTYADTVNKTGTQKYEPNMTNHNGSFFPQAPTIWTEGYFVGYNRFTVKTDVGKTDDHFCNNSSAPDIGRTYAFPGGSGTYLENMDGFIYVGKQAFLFSNADSYKIGESADHPIDFYCSGLYAGSINKKVQAYNVSTGTWNAEVTNPNYTAAAAVKDAGGTDATNGNGADQAFTLNGNLYCYDDGATSTDYNKSGNLYLMNGAHTCTVNGDCFVEHDIIIKKGCGLKVTGSLHVGGNIYVVDMTGDFVMKVNPNNSATITGTNLIDNAAAAAGYKPSAYITAGSFSKVVDKNDAVNPRNARPSTGYNASTGVDSNTRKTLKDTYSGATSNSIFASSLDSGSTYYSFSKQIAEKYARAMATPYSTSAKYKNLSGAEKDLVSKYDGTYSGNNVTVYQINSSCRLTQANYQKSGGAGNLEELNIFSVKLRDEDIVIALPLNDNIIPLIRVDSTDRVGDVFVYFTYYNNTTSDLTQAGNNITINNCLYLSDTSGMTSKTVTINNVWNGSSFVSKNVKFNASTASTRSSKTIQMNPNGKNICYCADITFYEPYQADAIIDFEKFVQYARKKLEDANVADFEKQGFQNYLIYFVPDDTSFQLGDNAQIQGILYAPGSYLYMGGSGTRIYGQVKCKRYKFGNDIKQKVIYNIPAAEGSILDYISAANSTSTNIEIQYYEY